MGKRYPRVPQPREASVSRSGRTSKHTPYGAILTTINVRGREVQLHATKGIRVYKEVPDHLMSGVVRGDRAK